MRENGSGEISQFASGKPKRVEARIKNTEKNSRGKINDSEVMNKKRIHESTSTLSSGVSPPKMGKLDKYGSSGLTVAMSANYFKVRQTPQFSLGQYRVDFEPDTEVTLTRKQIIGQNARVLGLTKYTFDGASLYSPTRLEERSYDCEFQSKPIMVTIRRTGTILNNDDQAFQILNLILRDAMAQLHLQNIKRNYYDPKAKIAVPEGKLELWPGYLTSIRTYENDKVLLCAEIIHKFMRNETIYEIARTCMRDKDWQDKLRREIIGTTVLTDYTNKTYNIDDIDFTMTPRSSFKSLSGDEQTFLDYYKNKYNISIKDERQMMLVSRARERDIRAGQPENIYLIPELSRATGLTDSLRADFRLMQKISNYTRLSPEDRVNALNKFNRRLQETPESIKILTDWELELSRDLIEFEARELPPEEIIFGDRRSESANQKAEWSIKGNTTMYSSVDVTRWIFLYPRELERDSLNFLRALIRAGEKLNYYIAEPLHRPINSDRQESYIKEIEEVAPKRPKLIVCALPSNRADRYSTIKRRCLIDFGIPCQVIVKNKTMNHKNLDSIATKVAIQINCKLGGIPWMIKLPIQGLMTVGFDVSHHPRDRSRSMGALCATMDLNRSSAFYSTTMEYRDGNEMVQNLDRYLGEACKQYKELHKELPDRIVFYRDGVGEGQIKTVEDQEVNPIKKLLERIYGVEGKTPKFAYIIVNKRVNARFFKKVGKNHVNPRPGTVIDRAVTMENRNDFYLISQHVGQGTVAPTYYNVITNTTGLSQDKIQILTYKMCHLYYNWGGTTRLPCVSQNAKKLAFLTSQSLLAAVQENLKNTLYFL